MVVLWCAACGWAGDKGARPAVRIGKVTVRRAEGCAEVKASVCLDKGILDYLCVAPDSGKEYESLLRLQCRASSLHAALLALGARPGALDDAFKGQGRGDRERGKSGAPKGARVRLSVRWRAGGHEREAPVSAWVIERATGRPPEGLAWVFTGSFFAPRADGKGKVYLADEERIIVAMLYHGACVLNLASAAGSPYQGDDKGYEINAAAVPPVETPVWVVFRVMKDSG